MPNKSEQLAYELRNLKQNRTMASTWYRVWDSVSIWALASAAAIWLVISRADLPVTLSIVFVSALIVSMILQLIWPDRDGAILRIGVTVLGVVAIIGVILAISWVLGWWQA